MRKSARRESVALPVQRHLMRVGPTPGRVAAVRQIKRGRERPESGLVHQMPSTEPKQAAHGRADRGIRNAELNWVG